jgi:hypothetical protein
VRLHFQLIRDQSDLVAARNDLVAVKRPRWPVSLEAVVAVDRPVRLWFEWNAGLATAFAANCFEHRAILPRTTTEATVVGLATGLVGATARRAAARLVGEAFFGVELLLTDCEDKLGGAVAAREAFVNETHLLGFSFGLLSVCQFCWQTDCDSLAQVFSAR